MFIWYTDTHGCFLVMSIDYSSIFKYQMTQEVNDFLFHVDFHPEIRKADFVLLSEYV